MSDTESVEYSQVENDSSGRQFCANGVYMKTTVVEAKLDEGNIQEAEAALREGLSLNFEEARALLGRLEYQRGNVEGALQVFEGIDLQAAIERAQPSLSERQTSRKGRSRSDSTTNPVSQHAASLVLEAVYLKAKSLQKLGRINDAARECGSVLDAVEKIFENGIPDVLVDNKLQETVSNAVELFPELWKQAGCYSEAMLAYRRALLSQWNLDTDCSARIQKAFAVFLLYSGVEAGPPSLVVQIDGSYVPKNNLEEAILLLMILMRKSFLGKMKWDPSVLEHLTFALSVCSQTSGLAKLLEELMPGIIYRTDRWKSLALCYSGAEQNETALNLLRKSLHENEEPDDIISLLLAAKICSEHIVLAAEGVKYAKRAVANIEGSNAHLKGVGLRMLGLCLGKQAKVSSSDFERSRLQSEALKSLDGAIALEPENSDLIFDLGVQYAEHRNLNAALRYAKMYIDATGGSLLRGWRLLALVLSAQQRFSEAEVVTDAALDETAKWDQGPVLRMKAKLKISQSLHTDAIETFRYLLALVQAQRKSYGPLRSAPEAEDDKVNEYDVWHGLANLYSSLSHWKDAEICLGKARALVEYSVETFLTEDPDDSCEMAQLGRGRRNNQFEELHRDGNKQLRLMVEELQQQIAEFRQGRNHQVRASKVVKETIRPNSFGGHDSSQSDLEFKMKIPKLYGESKAECFDWLLSVEEIFDFNDIPDHQRIPLVVKRLRGRAQTWWHQLKLTRTRFGKPKLNSWDKFKKHLKAEFLPFNYERKLQSRLALTSDNTLFVKELNLIDNYIDEEDYMDGPIYDSNVAYDGDEVDVVYDVYDDEAEFEENGAPVFNLYDDTDDSEEANSPVFDVYEDEDDDPPMDGFKLSRQSILPSEFVFDPSSDKDMEDEHGANTDDGEGELIRSDSKINMLARKKTQFLWGFPAYTHYVGTVSDEHARRSTTSIAYKISKTMQQRLAPGPSAAITDGHESVDNEDSEVERPWQGEYRPEEDDDYGYIGVVVNVTNMFFKSALSETSDKPKSGLVVRRLVVEPSVHEHIHQTAVVHIDNYANFWWYSQQTPNYGNDSNIVVHNPILNPKKVHIRNVFMSLLVTSLPRIQYEISKDIAMTGKHDFPQSWHTLLPELVTLDRLYQLYDYAYVNGVLAINVILKSYMQSPRLYFRFSDSLNLLEVPEFLKSRMNEWMADFSIYLVVTYPTLEIAGTDGFRFTLTLVDELRAIVGKSTRLYMEKDLIRGEEEKGLDDIYVWHALCGAWGCVRLATDAPKDYLGPEIVSHCVIQHVPDVAKIKGLVRQSKCLRDTTTNAIEIVLIIWINRKIQFDPGIHFGEALYSSSTNMQYQRSSHHQHLWILIIKAFDIGIIRISQIFQFDPGISTKIQIRGRIFFNLGRMM